MVYLDNAATTRIYDEIAENLFKYSKEDFYNPSALYNRAFRLANRLNEAREDLAALLGCNASELYFTSSGTESDNTVLFGARYNKNSRIIISAVEHSAIYKSAMQLKNKGYDVCLAEADCHGKVKLEHFKSLLTPNVSLVSIMHVNNETGAINDIKSLCKLTKAVSPKAVFHSDGVQAVGKLAVKLHSLGVDAYSFSGHKFHAPKGVGGLYIKKGTNVSPLLHGGGQEKGQRASTENYPAIKCMAEALSMTRERYNNDKLREYQRKMATRLREIEPNIIINSDTENGLPSILSFALPNSRGEVLMHMLDQEDVLVGTGSACSSNAASERIPNALGLPKEYKEGILRVSASDMTTEEEIDRFIEVFEIKYRELKKVMNG